MGGFLKWVNLLFNEYKLVRRFMVFWIILLISVVTYVKFFSYQPETADYLGVIGMLATVLAFYQWSRGKDK